MSLLSDIIEKVRRNERITPAEAVVLWQDAPLWLLGELATERKRKASGNEVYYNRNVHLEPTNICLFNCEFCSFRRREGDADAWNMSLDDITARARELQGSDITEVHIVGGVHPKHDLDTYCAMIRRVKSVLPDVTVKAYTAVEIFYMIRKAEVSVVEGLRRLKEAGMECIPGGGAEIFDETLRRKICPDKCSSEEWLAVHRAAHNMGIPTNCTMLYGHVETIEQRVDHLDRLRTLQDTAPGFDAFIPLKYRSRNNRMSEVGECSVEEDLRTIAMSRIYLDNIPHIKAYWVAYGKPTTEMALAFGADDIDGTIDNSTKIYSMAGADARPTMCVEELEELVHNAGFVAVERDSHYRRVERTAMRATVVAPVEEVSEPIVAPEPVIAPEPIVEPQPTPAVEPAPQPIVEPTPQPAPAVAPAPQPKEVLVKPEKEEIVKEENTAMNNQPMRQPSRDNKPTSSPDRGGKPSLWQRVKESFAKIYARFPILCHIFFIFLVGMLLLLCLYLGLRWGTRHGEAIVVPNLVGESVDEARRIADRLDLEIVVADSVFDSDVPGGTVMDQLPRTSDVREVTVKSGRKIYVTINAYNRRMMKVPNVVQLSLVQALNQLERSGFTVEKLVYEVDAISTDVVMREKIGRREITPTTNAEMPFGTGVTLHVTYRREDQLTSVPRLLGMRLSQARRTVWNKGLNVEKIVYDETVTDFKTRREATVYKQSLPASSGARRGAGITLYMTCNQALADSLARQADAKTKSFDAERRRREEELRAQIEAEELNQSSSHVEEVQSMEEATSTAPAVEASAEGAEL